MKTFNKIFAIAAIAAASMFSVQTASAGIIKGTNTSVTYKGDFQTSFTFEMLLGGEWTQYDALLTDNPNSGAIVLTCVDAYCKYTTGTLTTAEYTQTIAKLNSLGCPTELIAFVSYKMMSAD